MTDQTKPSKPLISVVIPHLNQPASLDACLASLSTQTLALSNFEVIVVDNGSASPPEAVTARYPGTRLAREPKPGPGLARNRGTETARADIFAFIDADCRADTNWLRNALQVLGSSPERTILGGDVRIWRTSNASITALEAYESVFAYRFKLYIEQHGFSGTGNLVVRRSDFNRVGPFRGIEVAEDIDWGQRARSAGFTFLYVPEMIVFHPARESLRELFVKWDRHIQHAVNTSPRNTSWQLRWLLRAATIFVSPLIDWTKVVASDRIHGISARMKAIAVLLAIRVYRAHRMISLLSSDKGVLWNRNSAVDKNVS